MDKAEYERGQIYHGDCLEVLRTLPANSVDSVVTDPPAGIAFMGKDWDDPDKWKYPISKHGFTDGGDRVPAPAISSASRNPNCRKCKRHKRGWKDVPGCACEEPDFDDQASHLESRDLFVTWLRDVMKECLRVLKPGGHAVVWSIPRTSHWTATAIEEAGFELRDGIYHVKPRGPEVQAFLESLTLEQRDLLARAEPTDQWQMHLFGSGFPKSLNIGKAIDKRRADNDLIRPWLRGLGSREEIATAADVTPRQVDHWLGDNTPCPQTLTEERFRRLCAHFGTIPEWADLMVEKVGATLGTVVHSRSGGDDFAKRPGSKASSRDETLHAPATPEAAQWEGWGTQLKPAVEVWWLARKPIAAQNVAAQVLKTGTGALNIDGARVKTSESLDGGAYSGERREKGGEWQSSDRSDGKGSGFRPGAGEYKQPSGRYPAHLVLSHSPECKRVGTKKVKAITGTLNGSWRKGHQYDGGYSGAPEDELGQEIGYGDAEGMETVEAWECVEGCPVRALDDQSGVATNTRHMSYKRAGEGFIGSIPDAPERRWWEQETGGASRFFHNFEPDPDAPFFYAAKASKSDKNEGLDESYPTQVADAYAEHRGRRMDEPGRFDGKPPAVGKNTHPTAKGQPLMRHLVRLVTPKGGVVLDPFAGSGSTLVAAVTEGMQFIGIEKEAEYFHIAQGRLNAVVTKRAEEEESRDAFRDLMGF